MRNDQIFVLLLVILLPLSGCFDNAVGDAEGSEDTSSGTTIVNNYYNTTAVEVEMFAIGGMPNESTPTDTDNDRMYHVGLLNSISGEALVIHEIDVSSNSSWSMPLIETECDGGENWRNQPGDNYELQPFILPGSFTNCTHTVIVYADPGEFPAWSLIYSIDSVTVQ